MYDHKFSVIENLLKSEKAGNVTIPKEIMDEFNKINSINNIETDNDSTETDFIPITRNDVLRILYDSNLNNKDETFLFRRFYNILKNHYDIKLSRARRILMDLTNKGYVERIVDEKMIRYKVSEKLRDKFKNHND
ncbi:hypothetical protein AB1K91_18670 [Terribacillus sp. 179-K 1B1 HS]